VQTVCKAVCDILHILNTFKVSQGIATSRIVGRTGRWPGQGNGHEDGQNRTVDIRVNRTWDRIGDRTVCRAEQCAEHDDGQSRTMVRVGR